MENFTKKNRNGCAKRFYENSEFDITPTCQIGRVLVNNENVGEENFVYLQNLEC